MSVVSVLIIVDVELALARGLSMGGYLIDTTGSLEAGTGVELRTACRNGDTIVWSVAPVAPGTNVSITSFTGQMVDDRICIPQQRNGPNESFWSGIVQATQATVLQRPAVQQQDSVVREQYSVVLSADGLSLSLDLSLVIRNVISPAA
jgi:hypothetical protein